MALDAASYPVLWTIYDQTNIRPEWLLPTLFAESGFNPAIQNQGGADYWGINQVSGSWLQAHLGITPQQYITWPASQQLLEVVLPMAKQWPKPLLSATRVEQANYLSATLNGGRGNPSEVAGGVWQAARYPTDIVVSKPGSGLTNASYDYNAGIDTHGGTQPAKGYITVADIEWFVGRTIPSIQNALAQTYALRPSETMTDPVIGLDPYLGPNPPPRPTKPGLPPMTKTNIALAAVGSVLILGTAGLIAWGLTADKHHALARENPVKSCPTGSKVQSLVFSRSRFDSSEAKSWARRHGFSAGYVDHKPSTLRIRQRSPQGWARMRTIKLAPGVSAVVGWKGPC